MRISRVDPGFALAACSILALALFVGVGPAGADQPPKPDFPVVVPAEPEPAPAPVPAPVEQVPEEDDFHWMILGGVGYRPDYEGSDHYDLHPLAAAKVWWDDGRFVHLQSSQSSGAAVRLATQLVPNSYLKFGPVVQYRLPRGDVQSGRVDAMDNIDGAWEVGAYGGLGHGPWSIGATYTYEVSEYHGHLVELATGWKDQLTDVFDMGLTIASTWANEDYMETYFGVDADDAADSGLDQYTPYAKTKDGFKDVGGRLTLGFGPPDWNGWKIVAAASYFRLIGDAADSPVVDDAGDENQFFGGIGVAYEH
jgi:outer membrane protein